MPMVVEVDMKGWQQDEKENQIHKMKQQGYRIARREGTKVVFVEKSKEGKDTGSLGF